ncbi:hypothetical protein [Streptomyces sp. NPDC059455]|uniref:hypothetical protein n=1 Tax=Streptomyces sp. NPDC059455 TaxID=3346837 RepID=UPI0036950AFE
MPTANPSPRSPRTAPAGPSGKDPQITWRGGWDRAEEAVTALLDRRLHGKAVLDIG